MKQIFFITLVLILAIPVFGQPKNVDSLINVLETQKLPVKETLELHKEICGIYKTYNFEKCMLYAKRGLAIAEKEKDKKMTSFFLNRIGALLLELSASDSSLLFFNQALKISQEIQDKQTEAKVLQNIGSWYHRNDKKQEALDYYLESLSLSEKIGDQIGSTYTLLNLSNFYGSMGQIERAYYYVKRAQNYIEAIDDTELKVSFYFELLRYYYHSYDFEKALENGLIALDYCRKNKILKSEITIKQYLAQVYLSGFQDFENAEKYALESKTLSESMSDKWLINNALIILTNIYRKGQVC
jgi:tetratricopeptide (TPR) repeat protein